MYFTQMVFNRFLVRYSKLLIGIVLLFQSQGLVFAQTDNDSVRLQIYQGINRKFPLANLVDVQYGVSTPTNIKTKIGDQNNVEAELRNQQRVISSINLPLYRSKKFMVLSSFNHRYESFRIKSQDSINNQSIEQYGKEAESSYVFSDAINLIYFGRLFGKTLTCNLITSFDFSDNGYEGTHVKAIASLLVKKTARTSIFAGILAYPDPTAQIPLVPVVSFTHWVTPKWLLDCYVPAYFYIRRPFADNSRFSFGVNMTSATQVYVHPDIASVSSFSFERGAFGNCRIVPEDHWKGLYFVLQDRSTGVYAEW